MIESRVCWTASSNISFHGATEWERGEGESPEEEERMLSEPQGAGSANLPLGLEQMLEAAGIDWWVEARVAADPDDEELDES